jgi:hypothetical protein
MSDLLLKNQIDWDPLNSNMDPEMLSASIKREIKNILKSYVGAFDPFAELIQNALDAVDRRAELMSENEQKDYEKKIWLTIDLSQNKFTIIDNGIGFKEAEFKSFLAPSISFKDGKNTRGNKGVGATYIAYGFNHLELGTKGDGFEFYGEIKDGRNWIEDVDGTVSRPRIKKTDYSDNTFLSIKRGSIFTLKFGGFNTRPKDLSWYQATTAEQWLYLLLIKSPLGGVDLLSKITHNVKFELTVIDKHNSKTTTNGDALYKYPHLVISANKNLADVRLAQEQLRQRGADMSKLSNKFHNLNGVYELFTGEQLKKLPTNKISEDEISLIDKYNVTAYGFFCYSTTVWDTLNDEVANLRKGFRVLKGGIQLSNNSMVQGDLIVIPLTQSIGYQNQTHIIIHFDNADPDLGRKGFQPELKELAEIIGVGIVNHLKEWRHLLKKDKGNRPDIIREMNLHEWVKKEEDFEKSHPLTISNPNFFNPVNEISISSEPQTEQDVIVLFSQLLAGGVIRGIKLLSTSQFKQYDGLYKFLVSAPIAHHVYDKEKNPLGVLIENCIEGTVSMPRVLEYKYNLDALIHEFENGEKKEREVSLVVVWDIGMEWMRNYDVVSLLDVENLHHRLFHGITHTFHTQTGNRFDAIILKELIQYLNDPTGSEKFQKSTYSENIE